MCVFAVGVYFYTGLTVITCSVQDTRAKQFERPWFASSLGDTYREWKLLKLNYKDNRIFSPANTLGTDGGGGRKDKFTLLCSSGWTKQKWGYFQYNK